MAKEKSRKKRDCEERMKAKQKEKENVLFEIM
jgi:hypothetical protein